MTWKYTPALQGDAHGSYGWGYRYGYGWTIRQRQDYRHAHDLAYLALCIHERRRTPKNEPITTVGGYNIQQLQDRQTRFTHTQG